MNNKGNSAMIGILFVAVIIIIIFFICAIFVGETNSILYNIKLDMYSINKSAIVAVNKGITSRTRSINYDKNEYLDYFRKMIKKNYNLDDNLINPHGLIQEVNIVDYEICKKGKKDSYTNEKLKDATIHSVIKVKIKPIIFEDLLKDKFVFYIHEDVALNLVEI